MDIKPKPKFVWVDPGCPVKGIPMSVIDAHPDVWIDKVTAARVAPEHKHRFKLFAEVEPAPFWDEKCKW